MPKDIWDQKQVSLLDIPKAADGAAYGQPGEALVVKADRSGLEWKQAGGEGSVGPANTLTIGTVTGGTSAAATITGTSPNQVLNLTLPKGDPGDQGSPGPAGADSVVPGPAGPVGPPGPGTQPNEFGNLTEAKIAQIVAADVDWIFIVNPESQVTQSGDLRADKTQPAALNGDMTGHMIRFQTSDNSWQDFGRWSGIPGQPGAPGPQSTTPGPAGPPPNIAIGTVAQGPAAATISGTSPNYTLNLTLPQGDPGVQGNPGPKAISTYAALASASINFAVDQADVVSRTVTAATTWTFTNPPAAGTVSVKVLELTNGGAFTQTWPASVKWEGGTAPTLTAAGLDILVFYTRDGGTTYRGALRDKDSK